MRKDDLKSSFDTVKPTEQQKQRMLDGIFSGTKKTPVKKTFRPKMVAAVFIAAVVALGGFFAVNNLINTPPQNTIASGDRANDGDRADNGALPATDDYREDMIAPALNQFKLEDKTYFLLTGDLESAVAKYPVAENDIGDKIATIKTGPDKSLIGCEVYFYKPAGCEAIVAVKQNGEYKLFKFLSFDSYNDNRDEDAAAYLNLYGIKSAGDIQKIQFIGHSEQAKLSHTVDVKAEITDKAEIAKFYNFYAVLKDSSDKYFDALYKAREEIVKNNESGAAPPDTVPPDYKKGNRSDQPIADIAEPDYAQDAVGGAYITPQNDAASPKTDYGSVSPSGGSPAGNPLAGSVTIRIYNKSGVYYETIYYPNIKFISRYELTGDFAEFLAAYIK